MARRIRRDDLGSRFLHRCLDLGLNWLAVALAYLVKEGYGIGVRTDPLTTGPVVHTFAALSLIWLLASGALDTYAYKRRFKRELGNLAAVLVVTCAFLLSYVYFTRIFVIPRYLMVLYPLVALGFLAASRAIKHVLQRMLHRRGIGVRRVLIVGNGQIA